MMEKLKKESGVALVEVLIAGLLLAIAVSAMMGAMLTSKRSGKRSVEREMAAMESHRLLQGLKNYVAVPAEGKEEPDAVEGAPGYPPGSGNWRIEGDPCNCWALAEGDHDATSWLSPLFMADYPGARMTYKVSVVNINNNNVRRVAVSLQWDGKG